ncbi:MAG: hypothetical protein D6715_04890 [Calditrichaeota bacterium]|nr:MAG: hypothetical protein D6715_04890 [Calditrichota bacterium]
MLQVVEELVRANYRLKKELAQWEKKGTNKQAEEKLTQLNRELEQLKRENRVLREREKLIQNKLERLEVKLDKINL